VNIEEDFERPRQRSWSG